jgi:uncharacterized membrane protein
MALSQEIYTSPAFRSGLKTFIFTEDKLRGSNAPANVAWVFYGNWMEDLSNLLTRLHSQFTVAIYSKLRNIDISLGRTWHA